MNSRLKPGCMPRPKGPDIGNSFKRKAKTKMNTSPASTEGSEVKIIVIGMMARRPPGVRRQASNAPNRLQ